MQTTFPRYLNTYVTSKKTQEMEEHIKSKISSNDKMLNELIDHIENLKLMNMDDRVVFYSYLTEQIFIHETPIASRR